MGGAGTGDALGEVLATRGFEPAPPPGATGTWGTESDVVLDGRPVRAVVVVASVGATLFALSWSAAADDSAWPALDSVLAAQATRLATGSPPQAPD